jgi:hypothetical protein
MKRFPLKLILIIFIMSLVQATAWVVFTGSSFTDGVWLFATNTWIGALSCRAYQIIVEDPEYNELPSV